jgi:hypothetical protein
MPKIQIYRGRVDENEANRLHLVRNHLLRPQDNIDKVIHYAERRYLMTFLTAGVRDGRYTAPGYYGKDTAKTVVKPVPQGELTSSMAWSYKVMGRLQKASVILGEIGTASFSTSTTGAVFTLKMRDNMLWPGMNAIFANGKIARVQNMPSAIPGGYITRFQSKPGENFDYATWIGIVTGEKTCFGGYSTYGERSLRGYGKVFYPDTYINHMTLQRKSMGISGDAHVEEVIWYEVDGQKGWTSEAEVQTRVTFGLEDEFQKWWGVSNMRDSNGNLISSPTHVDEESGEPLTEGDGLVEQIRGANDMDTSGTDGLPVYQDFVDMVNAIKNKADRQDVILYAVTGTEGMTAARDVIEGRFIGLGGVTNLNAGDDAYNVPIGYDFNILKIGGSKVIFVENPQMNDEQKFPLRLSNGKLKMSLTYYFINQTPDETNRPNVEIRTRGRGGINRNYVMLWKNGMTGDGTPQESIDAKEYHILKQNMLVIYDTKTCGIMQPYPGA